jgi:rhamnogalacturonan endolyase
MIHITKIQKLTIALCAFSFLSIKVLSQVTPVNEMEKIDRGIIAVKTNSGYLVSWRFYGTDDNLTTFDLYRNGALIKNNISTSTNYLDTGGSATSKYQVLAMLNGICIDSSKVVTPWNSNCKTINIDQPAGGISNSGSYTYVPSEASCGDVDGDGEYEIILKWLPTNQQDPGETNTDSGSKKLNQIITGNTFVDCYKMDGTKLWRISLGDNIRSGFHYTQVMVYDLDRNGKAEVVLKTAPGSIDGTGKYVTEAATDATIKNADNTANYVCKTAADSTKNVYGRIMGGPEYLTVFNGETGAAIHTVYYNPNRAGGVGGSASYPSSSSFWGDNYGNRSERYLACVAYLDGPDKNPSVVMCRGYYTRAYLCAWDFDGTKLSQKWLHASITTTNWQLTNNNGTTSKTETSSNTKSVSSYLSAYGQGTHSIAVGDVDNDGCDEIIYGAATINNDGTLLYSTGLGHGDAQHLSDLMPDRSGLEYYQVHESKINDTYAYGDDVHDAATGEILIHHNGTGDTGRGIAADIDSLHRGFEYWDNGVNAVCSVDGSTISTSKPSQNFRVYWDADVYDELLDNVTISKWNGSKAVTLVTLGNNSTTYTSKATPVLQADLLGDWREEIIEYNSDCKHLNIFETNYVTTYRVPTLMHDHLYRMGIVWQNVAYNQPPHLGYFLPDYVAGKLKTAVQTITISNSRSHKQVYVISKLFTNQISMTFNLKKEQDIHISMYTINGSEVLGENFHVSGHDGLSISGFERLVPGLYLIKITTSEGTFSEKLIKK